MGKPKFSRKKYVTPSHPWQEDRIKAENELIKKYGLKNKREIWKAQTRLRNYRGQARELEAKILIGDIQSKKERDQLLVHLNRMNILPPKSTLDDVLALETEAVLSRRLQTLTYLRGFASTPNQARQLISHGHIAIGNNRVTVPGYIVTKEEEGEIGYIHDSPLNDMMHPARPRSDFKSIPIKKETKPEEEYKEEMKKESANKVETTEVPSTTETDKDETKEEKQKPAEKPTTEPEKKEEPSKEEKKTETTQSHEQPKSEKETTNEETKKPKHHIEPKEEKKEEKPKEEQKQQEKQIENKDKNKEKKESGGA
jgi:small subunit ribosomal protein S4